MYEMKPEYYIGIEMIDEEHKQLFKYAAENTRRILPPRIRNMNDVMKDYKKLFTQKIQHHEFISKLDEFIDLHKSETEDQDKQIMDILEYLTEWLVNHILYVDGQIPKG